MALAYNGRRFFALLLATPFATLALLTLLALLGEPHQIRWMTATKFDPGRDLLLGSA
jgi:hypothetical protein